MASAPRPAPLADAARVLQQIRWVSRLSVALSSAARVEDVLSVLAAGIISPTGLGYSRAIAFEADASRKSLRGLFSLALESLEDVERLREELLAEQAYLESRGDPMPASGPDPDTGDASDQYRTLRLSSQWVTVFQELGGDGQLSSAVRGLEVSLADPALKGSALSRAFHHPDPRAVSLKAERPRIPRELAPLLGEEFALLPLHTKKGLRGLLVVDRRLTGEPIGTDDIEFLDWFATQGALAVQNADLIADLERAYAELKNVDAMKSNFLATVSHELRTPLTAITGFVDLMLGGKAGETTELQHNLLRRVAKNAGHLANIVNDLIDIAEIQADEIEEVHLEDVDPLDVLMGTLPRLEYRRRDRSVTVEPVLHGLTPRVRADRHALERVFFRLIDNAIKFSPEHDRVLVDFLPLEDNRLAISIVDQGVGIPEDKLQRIFDEFYQVDNSSTRSFEGLGLGLAIVRLIVARLQGSITVKSKVGEGSTFTVTLPCAREQPSAP